MKNRRKKTTYTNTQSIEKNLFTHIAQKNAELFRKVFRFDFLFKFEIKKRNSNSNNNTKHYQRIKKKLIYVHNINC